MPPRRILLQFSLIILGCCLASNCSNVDNSGECTCVPMVSNGATPAGGYHSGRGALLGSRFASFDALKSVIQIEYSGPVTSDSAGIEYSCVRVRHCSNGREVINVLETGTSQGDILKTKYHGTMWDRFCFLFRSPYVVMSRKELQKAFYLSRWSPELFGEGDPAFFDIAKSAVANINTPDLAFQNTRDSTEKGYINTFNHITAQAFMTSCFSEELADFIGDSHERFRHPELITGKFTQAQIEDLGEGPLDNYVDLINNEWGQELGNQLREKYQITSDTKWTPALMANYLNDLQAYYSWAFQIGFKPYRPEDEIVCKFSDKLGQILNGRLNSVK